MTTLGDLGIEIFFFLNCSTGYNVENVSGTTTVQNQSEPNDQCTWELVPSTNASYMGCYGIKNLTSQRWLQSSGVRVSDPSRGYYDNGYGINVSNTGISVDNLTSIQLWKFIYQQNGNLQIQNVGANGYLDDWYGGNLQITTISGWLPNNSCRSWDMDSIGSDIADPSDLDDVVTSMFNNKTTLICLELC